MRCTRLADASRAAGWTAHLSVPYTDFRRRRNVTLRYPCLNGGASRSSCPCPRGWSSACRRHERSSAVTSAEPAERSESSQALRLRACKWLCSVPGCCCCCCLAVWPAPSLLLPLLPSALLRRRRYAGGRRGRRVHLLHRQECPGCQPEPIHVRNAYCTGMLSTTIVKIPSRPASE
jgi:hypothetical protein